MAGFGWKNIARATLTDTEDTVFINPDATQTGIKEIEFVNTSSVDVYVYFFLTNSTMTVKHTLVHHECIRKNGRWKWNGWKVMEDTGDLIRAYATVGGVVELFVDGGAKR